MSIPLRALLYRRKSQPDDLLVQYEGEVFPVLLRRQTRARRYTLRINAAKREVVLTMPLRGNLKQASEFAHKHGAWISERLRRLPQTVPFKHGSVLPLRGIPTRIEHQHGMRGTVWVDAGADGSALLCVAGKEPHVARRIRDYLKQEAKRDLEAASKQAAQVLGVRVSRISIRDQVSRWGSCSTTGVLSYSWRLIMAPPFVLEYLAAHEVAHLIEMNHSRRFWRLVARICPQMSGAKAWLHAHGADLYRYGMQETARETSAG